MSSAIQLLFSMLGGILFTYTETSLNSVATWVCSAAGWRENWLASLSILPMCVFPLVCWTQNPTDRQLLTVDRRYRGGRTSLMLFEFPNCRKILTQYWVTAFPSFGKRAAPAFLIGERMQSLRTELTSSQTGWPRKITQYLFCIIDFIFCRDKVVYFIRSC